jgi:hypothetical protein
MNMSCKTVDVQSLHGITVTPLSWYIWLPEVYVTGIKFVVWMSATFITRGSHTEQYFKSFSQHNEINWFL